LAAILAKDTELYHKCDYRKPSAFILGTEATGLSQEWIGSANRKIMIPMMGSIDSLNVSNAAAVLLFEAARQRNFAKS
jgi:TrmH family RNA methyltransferase